MLSLARQLALRREIEEEMGELAGEKRATDWGEAVNAGLAVSAPVLPPVRCCVACSTPLPGRGRRLYCDAHRPANWTGKDRHSPRSIARARARKKAQRRAARAGRTCACGAAIPLERNANTVRCDACRRAAESARSRLRVRRRSEQRRAARAMMAA